MAELILLGNVDFADKMDDIIDDRLKHVADGGKKWMKDDHLIRELDQFRKVAASLEVKEIVEQLHAQPLLPIELKE